MADLALAEQFGEGATISGGVLAVTLSQIGLEATSPTTSQILGALVLKRQNLMTDALANDPTVGCFIGEPFPGLTTRNGRQQAEQQYTVSLYKDVTTDIVSISDPDDIAV